MAHFKKKTVTTFSLRKAVDQRTVVAQLVARLLTTLEVRSLNPVINKMYMCN